MLPEIRIVETPGGRFALLPTDSIISRAVANSGFFERHIFQIAHAVLQRAPGSGAVLDIGANIGSFAVPLARATGRSLLCFEPQRVIGQLLAANFILNRIDNARWFQCALGDPEGAAEIELPAVDYATEGNFGALSVDAEIFATQSLPRMAVLPGEPGESCRLARLDEFGFDDVALIKIDVEGYEERVLRGGMRTLEVNRFPPILFEAWRDDWYRARREALLAFLEGLGYDISPMDENYLAQHRTRPPQERVEVKKKLVSIDSST